MSIQLTVHGTGSGKCALSGKDEADGLTVAFQGEPPCFLSFKSFKMILAMKAAQLPKGDPKPVARPATPVAMAALPQNGPALAAPK